MALLRTLGLNRPRYYEPKFRLGHYAGTVGGECFVFAGRTGDFLKTKEELSSTIEVFDQYLERWRALKTTGSHPKDCMLVGAVFPHQVICMCMEVMMGLLIVVDFTN